MATTTAMRAGWPIRPCGKCVARAAGRASSTAGGRGTERLPCPSPAGIPSRFPDPAATETATASPASAATAGGSPVKNTTSTATPGSCEASGAATAGCAPGWARGCPGTSLRKNGCGWERGHLPASLACCGLAAGMGAGAGAVPLLGATLCTRAKWHGVAGVMEISKNHRSAPSHQDHHSFPSPHPRWALLSYRDGVLRHGAGAVHLAGGPEALPEPGGFASHHGTALPGVA